MIFDGTFMQGNIRGMSGISLVYECLNEWIEYNVTIPDEIHISTTLSKIIESELGKIPDLLISVIGEHKLVVDPKLGRYQVEIK